MGVNFFVAFLSGLVSFFAPCMVPLIPAYIGYVSGVSLSELKKEGEKKFKKAIIESSVLYILGFSLVFVALGTAAAGLGVSLRKHQEIIQRVGGVLIVIFGLEFAGLLHLPFLAREKKVEFPKWVNKLGKSRAFFLGLIFGLSWSPCVGVVLGSILVLAAQSSTVVEGAALLWVYSLGISIPFLVISLSLSQAPKYLKVITKKIELISKVSGIFLVIIGLLLMTNTYKYLNGWLFELARPLNYQTREFGILNVMDNY